MYEDYSKQALPPKKYRELLGSALCVFNSNNQFIIENILKSEYNSCDWYELMDRTAGQLKANIRETITKESNQEIGELFHKIVDKRNRIVHSFQITNKNGEQILATKEQSPNNKQFQITEDFLMKFIQKNEELSSLLHEYRGY